MRRIDLISTGGTIEKEYDEDAQALVNRGSVVERMVGSLRFADTHLRHRVLMYKDSLDLTDADRAMILAAVRESIADADGVIVLHGTDTLAVTGELLLRELRAAGELRAPVILTGAFRPFELKSTDALQNLTESIFAASVLASGVYCVVHGRALAFPGVVKDHAKHTFRQGPGAAPR